MNDRSYKEDIQETVYHKIIKLEHQLKKQGYLSKVFEIKAFWDFILCPGNLEEVMQKGKLSWEDILQYERTHRDTLMSSTEETQHKWTNSDINKMIADNARPSWHNSKHARSNVFTPSGLTDISSSQSGRGQSAPTSKQKSITNAQSNGALTFDQKFPKVEFPPLAAYRLVFGEQEPDPEEIERELEIQRKEEAKRDTRNKLLTMFSHALANRAATQRLIERNEEYSFNQLVDTSSVKELMYYENERKPKVQLTTKTLQAHDRLSSPPHAIKKKGGSKKISSKKMARTPSPESEFSGTEREMVLYREYKRLPPIAAPLSLHVLEQTNQVKEAKGLSTLWVNPF
ncbi:uncharacterized protein LOC116291774 [Actinia tenebrosa]|nr:uncharacterized protein LOC116291774 [Actinia tenebrosa]